MIELRGTEVRSPAGQLLLGPVTLRVGAGEFVLLIGPNGAGKSTLLRLLCGIEDPARGSVVRERGPRAGLVLQDPASQLVAATVARDVAFGPECRREPTTQITAQVERALSALDLQHLAVRHPQRLSGGQQQRVALAGALAGQPELLMLDEPASQLDPAAATELGRTLAQLHTEGLTVVMASQRPQDLVLATRVVALVGGQVALDTTPRLLAQQLAEDQQLQQLLGIELPAPARLALELGAPGASRDVPLTMAELADRLYAGAPA